jgi:hypothetical protein
MEREEETSESASTAYDTKRQALALVKPLVCEDEKRTESDASADAEEYALGADELSYTGAKGACYV